MRKLILFNILLIGISFSTVLTSQNHPFSKGERLKYNIYYQWGFIWKKAAEATLITQETIFQSDKVLQMRLAAKTTSFFDNFLRVRDTLVSLTSPELQPKYYAKITNEGKYHGKDDLFYIYNGNGKISTRSRTFRDRKLKSDTTMVHTSVQLFDMLSVFYYIRTLNLAGMKKNQVVPIIIVSGIKPYNVKVTYNGETSLETPDDKTYQTYKLTLSLESSKGKEDMNLWMSKDAQRLPILLSAKLPLGSMKAFFEGIE